MSKFFFFETQTMELLVTKGKQSGGAAVPTLVWMEGLWEKGHEIFRARLENDNREIRLQYNKIQNCPNFSQK